MVPITGAHLTIVYYLGLNNMNQGKVVEGEELLRRALVGRENVAGQITHATLT
jgi:hypothetical protein